MLYLSLSGRNWSCAAVSAFDSTPPSSEMLLGCLDSASQVSMCKLYVAAEFSCMRLIDCFHLQASGDLDLPLGPSDIVDGIVSEEGAKKYCYAGRPNLACECYVQDPLLRVDYATAANRLIGELVFPHRYAYEVVCVSFTTVNPYFRPLSLHITNRLTRKSAASLLHLLYHLNGAAFDCVEELQFVDLPVRIGRDPVSSQLNKRLFECGAEANLWTGLYQFHVRTLVSAFPLHSGRLIGDGPLARLHTMWLSLGLEREEELDEAMALFTSMHPTAGCRGLKFGLSHVAGPFVDELIEVSDTERLSAPRVWHHNGSSL